MTSLPLKTLVGRLNAAARRALEAAAGLAVSRQHYEVGLEHWLYKLLEDNKSDVFSIFHWFGLEPTAVMQDLSKVMDKLKTGQNRTPGLAWDLVLSIERAWLFATLFFEADQIRSGHLLTAILDDEHLNRCVKELSSAFGSLPFETISKSFAEAVKDSSESTRTQLGKNQQVGQMTIPDVTNPLKRRYQVFVSSTYTDLLVERQHVMHALLETKCIPSGMELFPAASDEHWAFIQRVIAECDYYMVMVAGYYGTISKEGKSYTEMEYDYAVEIGKPIIGFFHDQVDSLPKRLCEQTEEREAKLVAFRRKVQSRLCKSWRTPEGLASAVKSAILHQIELNPSSGWIRLEST